MSWAAAHGRRGHWTRQGRCDFECSTPSTPWVVSIPSERRGLRWARVIGASTRSGCYSPKPSLVCCCLCLNGSSITDGLSGWEEQPKTAHSRGVEHEREHLLRFQTEQLHSARGGARGARTTHQCTTHLRPTYLPTSPNLGRSARATYLPTRS